MLKSNKTTSCKTPSSLSLSFAVSFSASMCMSEALIDIAPARIISNKRETLCIFLPSKASWTSFVISCIVFMFSAVLRKTSPDMSIPPTCEPSAIEISWYLLQTFSKLPLDTM